jgi:hypothetical protein
MFSQQKRGVKRKMRLHGDPADQQQAVKLIFLGKTVPGSQGRAERPQEPLGVWS